MSRILMSSIYQISLSLISFRKNIYCEYSGDAYSLPMRMYCDCLVLWILIVCVVFIKGCEKVLWVERHIR